MQPVKRFPILGEGLQDVMTKRYQKHSLDTMLDEVHMDNVDQFLRAYVLKSLSVFWQTSLKIEALILQGYAHTARRSLSGSCNRPGLQSFEV